MCGIFCYVGGGSAKREVFDGLKRLDYRGHDSWGLATLSGGEISVFKRVGKINIEDKDLNITDGNIGIGHTRWATHGAVNSKNAHPHYASDKSFVLVHNGIVENFSKIKKELMRKGYKFVSETDTEVIVRLIELKRKNKTLFAAVLSAFRELEGRNTIAILSKDREIIAARNGSPLVVGLSDVEGEIFFSSDTLSFANQASKMIILNNGELVYYKGGRPEVYNIKDGKERRYKIEDVGFKAKKVDKEGFDHFMIKEIFEAPYVLAQVINQERDKLEALAKKIKNTKRVFTLGSGTTGLAASQVAYYLRTYSKIPATSLLGAESQSYYEFLDKDSLVITVSQSGETADVLEVIEKAKTKNISLASYVNMPGSMITRLSDYRFMTNAGPEICVMSTKVFVSQIAWGYLLAKTVAGSYEEGIKNLKILADKVEKTLNDKSFHRAIKKISRRLLKDKDIFLLGKSQNLQIVNEGMVKIIEGTYKHAHAMPAGDLKHYAITLMEEGVPVITVVSNDEAKDDMINAISEVKARGARIVGIAPEKLDRFDDWISVPDTGETSAILNVIPLQLLSYYMTVMLGNDVDKPRNIAKSVTVK